MLGVLCPLAQVPPCAFFQVWIMLCKPGRPALHKNFPLVLRLRGNSLTWVAGREQNRGYEVDLGEGSKMGAGPWVCVCAGLLHAPPWNLLLTGTPLLLWLRAPRKQHTFPVMPLDS